MSTHLDESLKYISVRNQWGCQDLPNTVLAAEGKELLFVSGCRVVVYDEEEGVSGERRLLTNPTGVVAVAAISISPCKKLAAVCVKRDISPNKAVALVYELDTCRMYPNTLPHFLSHEDNSNNDNECISFSNAVFSNDSKLLACYSTDRAHVGVLIFDWKLRRLLNTVKLKAAVHCMSFNPENSSRICTGGSDGMFQFWHYTAKNSYEAPINGLQNDVKYTSHAWLSSDSLIAGTSTGVLLMIVGCEVKAICGAFGMSKYVKAPVTALLLKNSPEGGGALLLAYSREGFVSINRVTRSQGRAGGEDLIVQQYNCLLMDSATITGLAWRNTTDDDLTITVASVDSIHTYDLALRMQHLLKYHESLDVDAIRQEEVVSKGSRTRQQSLKNALSLRYWKDNSEARIQWPRMPSSRCVMSFHNGSIRQFATSCRNSLLVSSSLADETVRLWDYNRVESSERLIANYSQIRTELPLALDIHPSGFFVASGTEDFATEHAVTNNKLEPLRKIPMKMALEKSTGEAVHNTAHVSLVRYSHGGHLLAVVTGKLAQVFRLNHLNYNYEKAGVPECIMTMTDHHAPITDLAFNSDDSKLFTSSSDGQVFEWTVSASTTRRDKDFVLKNVSAIQVAVSPSNSYIMAAFRNIPQGQRMLTKQNSESNLDPSSGRVRRESGEATPIRRRLSKTFSQGGDEGGGHGVSNRSFLVMWKDTITSNDAGEVIMELETPVSTICFGKLDGRESPEICILGLNDGSVVVSMLPVPLRVFVPPQVKAPAIHGFGTFSREQGSMRDVMAVRNGRVGGGSMSRQGGLIAGSVPEDPGSLDDDFFELPLIDEKNGTDDDLLGTTAGNQSSPLLKTSLSRGESFSLNDERQQYMTIDESLCRVLQLHDGPVTNICMSSTGFWIFTSGQDGCMFMLNSSLRAREMVEVVEAQSNEHQIILTDRLMLKNSMNSLEDKDSTIEEMKKDFQKSTNEMNLAKKNETASLNDLMNREISKRDDIIMQGRNDLLQAKSQNAEHIAAIHKQYKEQLAELEVMYERKLAHESLYLQNMKQAYDEFVTHARMDLEENNRKAHAREQALNQQNEDIANLTEKNKKILLQYCEYVGDRHREVLTSLTEQHDKDKETMTLALREKQEEITNAKVNFRHEKAKTKREMQKLGAKMTAKDMEVLNTAQELDRAQDRAARLETALQSAMDDIGRKQDALTRWEFKCGEQQQKLSELERVRKALVSQLHALREEMGPKDMKIIKTVDKLNEVDKEYDKSIKAISEKEQKLAQNSNTLNLMNKQVRELRLSVTNKEKALKRASQLLDEFNYSLQQARFLSHKTTVNSGGEGKQEASGPVEENAGGEHDALQLCGMELGPGKVGLPRGNKKTGKLNFGMGGEIVELISSTPAMEMALQRLFDVLNPHSDIEDGGLGDEQKIINEKDRQITVLRNNITGLKANIKLNESVSNLKIHNYLTNNENLNEEMNALRKSITKLTTENDSLKAFIANEERARNARKPAEMMTVDGETANKRLPPFEQKVIEPSMPEPLISMSESAGERQGSVNHSSTRGHGSERTRPEHPASRSIDKDRETGMMESSMGQSSMSSNSMTRADKMINELLAANSRAIAEEKLKANNNDHSISSANSGRYGDFGIVDSRKGNTFSKSGNVPVVALGFTEEKSKGPARFSTKTADYSRAKAKSKSKSKNLNPTPSAPNLQTHNSEKSRTDMSSTNPHSSSYAATQFPKLNKTST